MNGLFGDTEPERDVLPGPARASCRRHLISFELLGQSAQASNGPEAHVGIGRANRVQKIVACAHLVSIS